MPLKDIVKVDIRNLPPEKKPAPPTSRAPQKLQNLIVQPLVFAFPDGALVALGV